MSKHTPGPWRPGKNSDDVVADSPSGHDDESAVEYYGGHLVAESICSKNRALIVAAPELLESLTNLVGLARLGAAHLDKYHAALASAEAVIAKATA